MGGSSKKVTVGYKYYLGMHMVLCHGPADKLYKIQVDKRDAWTGISTGGTLSVNAPNLFGGEEREGGITGDLDFEMGAPTQTQNTYLQARLGTDIPAFRGVVGAVLKQMYLGVNPYFKAWSFRLQRILTTSDGSEQWYPDKAPIPARASPLALSFVLDGSGSMLEIVSGSTTRWDIQVSEVNEALDSLKSIDTNLKINVSIFGDPGNVYSLSKTITSSADIIALQSFIENFPIVVPFGTYWDEGMQSAADFYASAGAGTKELIFVTDGQPTGEQTTTDAAVAIRNNLSPINVHVINIDLGTTTYSNQLDNTGGTDIVNSTTSNGLRDTVLAIIAEYFEFDMNPAHIIRESLTDSNWGMGYLDADIDDTSFTLAADALYSESMGISLLWDRQIPIEDFVAEIVRHINAALYVDRITGKFVLKLIRSDYDEGTLLELDESNIMRVSDYSRVDPGDAINSVTVVYWDGKKGENASITADDPALIQAYGAVVNTTVQYPGFTNTGLAARAAARDLQTFSSPLLSATIEANREASSLNIGDVFKFTWPDYHSGYVVMRVHQIAFGDGKRNRVKITASEDIFALPDTVAVVEEDSGWTDVVKPATAPPDELVYEAPYYELVQNLGETSANDLLTTTPEIGFLGVAASRPSGGLSARIWVDAGAGYEDSANLDFCPSCTLDQALDYTTETFDITDMEDLDQVTTGTHVQMGTELMRVDSIDTGAGSITVGRGVLDTLPVEHTQGERMLFWDFYSSSDNTEYVDSEDIDVKILTNSGQDAMELADTVANNLVFASRAIKPYPPAQFKVNTVAFGSVIDGLAALALTYVDRDRLQQTSGTLLDQTDAGVGPEASTTYTLRIYGESDTLGRTETGLTSSGYTYDKTDEENDFEIAVANNPFNYSGYLSGYNGEVWLANSSHFQDTARTTATAVDDPIGSLTGSTGTYHGEQSSASRRPTLRESGGKRYIEFDGSDDGLQMQGGTSAWNYVYNATGPDAYIVAALRMSVGSADPNALMYFLANNIGTRNEDGFTLYYDDRASQSFDDRYRLLVGDGSDTEVYDDGVNDGWQPQVDVVIEFIRSGSGFTCYLDGVSVFSGTYSTPQNNNADHSLWMCNSPDGTNSGAADAYVYGAMVCDRIPDTAQRAAIHLDMSSRCLVPPLGSASGYRINGRLRIELEAVRGSYTSYQKYNHEILREGYGFAYGYFYGGDS